MVRNVIQVALLGMAMLTCAAVELQAAPAEQACIDGLSAPEIHPGWSYQRRLNACTNAGTECVLTIARLRPIEFNEILLNEECLYDYDNCVGELAEAFARHDYGWWRGNLRNFCANADVDCVLETKLAHPSWTNLDVEDYCRLPSPRGDRVGTVPTTQVVYGIAEGSPQAARILDLVNNGTEYALTSERVGLSVETARRIASHPHGFGSLSALAALPVSAAEFQLLARW